MEAAKIDTELNRLRFLASTGWLAEEPAGFRARVARLGSWIAVARGGSIYEAGDEPSAIYGLGEGLLDVLFPLDDTEEVLLHRAPPGFWIGDATLLTGMRRIVSLRAAVDSRLFAVPGGAMRQNLARFPGDWVCLQRLAARNAGLAVTILAELLALPPQRRFAKLLLRSASPDGLVHATQEELGHMTGMGRMAFRRAFGTFIETGVVRTEYGSVRILDRARLVAIAEASDGQ